MKILIIGANSYIGTSVENYLLSFCAQTQKPASCCSSSPNVSIGDLSSLSPDPLSANCKAVAQSPVSFCSSSCASPSSCAESQEPESLGYNELCNGSCNEVCNASRNGSCNDFPSANSQQPAANSNANSSFIIRHSSFEYAQNAYEVHTLDMLNPAWRERSFSGYDAVFHVAGIAHSDTGNASEETKALYYKVNRDLTIETVKKAKADGVRQFIFMSSIIVYGESAPIGKEKIITKDTQPAPANFYGDSKLQAERGLLELADDSFKVVILRPPMIYGKGSKGNYPLLAKLAQKLPVFPYVSNKRSMLYIENLAEFVRLMIENEESGIFCPQNSEYASTSEMVKLIAKAHGKNVILIKGFATLLRLAGCFTGLANKAFGNLTYDKALSGYKQDYCVCDFEESIKRTESA